jgi:hypothetical protein
MNARSLSLCVRALLAAKCTKSLMIFICIKKLGDCVASCGGVSPSIKIFLLFFHLFLRFLKTLSLLVLKLVVVPVQKPQ